MQSEVRHEIVAPAFVLALGLATILGAWGFQLIGGYVPCALCLEQRVPYYVGLPLVLASLLAAFAGAKPTVVRMLLIVAALIFAYNIYLASLSGRRRVGLVGGTDRLRRWHPHHQQCRRPSQLAQEHQGGELHRGELAAVRPLIRRLERCRLRRPGRGRAMGGVPAARPFAQPARRRIAAVSQQLPLSRAGDFSILPQDAGDREE